MSVRIAVLKEVASGERRVALVPGVVAKYAKLGAQIWMESGAGLAVKIADSAYSAVTFEPDPVKLVAEADIVLCLQPPSIEIVTAMRRGSVLICFVYAMANQALVAQLRDGGITCFAMELVPRISRAQAMDALSSQAALAGYYAPLLGAVHMSRILPMMTTAVGSLRAANVLVLGLGVAGLQALATAHRLGAITLGYDVRPETKEQALSLGAKFIDTGLDATGQGGYARELSADERARVQEILTHHIQEADMIVTTAAVPGRAAPKLITRAQVDGMKRGAVIIDLAAEGGGNCEYTSPGETVEIGPVTILAPLNVPSLLGEHASELYAKNLLNLVGLVVHDGTVNLDWTDEVVAGTVLTHAGEIRNAAARQLFATTSPSRTPEIGQIR